MRLCEREIPCAGCKWNCAYGKDSELILRANGYVRDPNNIYGVAGSGWYAGGPGILVPKSYHDSIRIINNKFVIVREVPGIKAPGAIWEPMPSIEVAAKFDDLAGLMEWLSANGKISEGGQCAIPQNWD